MIEIKGKYKAFLYGFCFQIIILLFIFGIIFVGYEAENGIVAESLPVFICEMNDKTLDIAIFGQGISIDIEKINQDVLILEKLWILIPPKYRLCMQIIKIIKKKIFPLCL